MKILGIIPSRYASMRLPGKPLVPINGVPMVVQVYRQARKLDRLTQLVVAIEDKRVARALDAHEIPYCMTDPSHANGTARCWEAYEKMGKPYDFVLNIQGDEPFLQPPQLDTLIDLLIHTQELAIGTLIKRISEAESLLSSNTIKVVCDEDGCALYFSRQIIPFLRSEPSLRLTDGGGGESLKVAQQALSAASYYKHIGLYAYRPDVLQALVRLRPHPLERAESLEQLRWLAHGYRVHTAETSLESISIDSEEDIKSAKRAGLIAT